MFFLWLKNVDLAISRVRDRVPRERHDIPEPVIRRRFDRSTRNFLMHYRQVADAWMLFDNSGEAPRVIALEGSGNLRIINKTTYAALVEHYGNI